jgi:hypothetical protein
MYKAKEGGGREAKKEKKQIRNFQYVPERRRLKKFCGAQRAQ